MKLVFLVFVRFLNIVRSSHRLKIGLDEVGLIYFGCTPTLCSVYMQLPIALQILLEK